MAATNRYHGLVAAFAATVLSLALPAGAPASESAVPLVKNRGFESGTFAFWTHGQVAIDHFLYARTGTHSVAVSGDNGYVSQRVGLGGFAAIIDNGEALLTAGAYHAGYEPVWVSVTFLDEHGARLGGRTVSGTAPGSHSVWKRLAVSRAAVPVGTRSIRLRVFVKDVPDGMADIEWDDAFLTVIAP